MVNHIFHHLFSSCRLTYGSKASKAHVGEGHSLCTRPLKNGTSKPSNCNGAVGEASLKVSTKEPVMPWPCMLEGLYDGCMRFGWRQTCLFFPFYRRGGSAFIGITYAHANN